MHKYTYNHSHAYIQTCTCIQVAARYNVTVSALSGDSSSLLDTLNVVADTGSAEELECVCSFLSFRLALEALFDSQHPCYDYFLGTFFYLLKFIVKENIC